MRKGCFIQLVLIKLPNNLRRVKESNPQPEGWHGFQIRLSTDGCYSPIVCRYVLPLHLSNGWLQVKSVLVDMAISNIQLQLAEGVRFELTVRYERTAVFKTAVINQTLPTLYGGTANYL